MLQVSSNAVAESYVVKQSEIHGQGLFAARRIEAGELIGHYEGPIVSDNGDHVLWVVNDDDFIYGIDGQNELRYVNHAPDANASFYGNELYADRTIESGQEITHHYGNDWD